MTRLVALLALLLALPAPAVAARRRADLTAGSARAQGVTTLRVTVRNRGRAAARASQLSAASNGKVLARTRVAALKPRRSVTVSLTLPRLAPGRHDLSICADAGKAVREASERNNCTKLTLTVPAPGAGSPPLALASAGDPGARGDSRADAGTDPHTNGDADADADGHAGRGGAAGGPAAADPVVRAEGRSAVRRPARHGGRDRRRARRRSSTAARCRPAGSRSRA